MSLLRQGQSLRETKCREGSEVAVAAQQGGRSIYLLPLGT